MTKSKSEVNQKFSKSAFLDAAKDKKERLLIQTLLDDDTPYSKDEVSKILKEWKTKEVKA